MKDSVEFLKKNLFNILLVFILCGRFYFIFGFTGMLKPVVDFKIIVLKDIVFLGLSAFSIYKFKDEFKKFFKQFRPYILGALTIFVLILCLHSFSKSPVTLFWHYARNIYMYVFLIPISFVLFRQQLLNIERIIDWVLVVNLIFCGIQMLFLPNIMLDGTRPLGVVGDPIVSSVLNYLLLFKIILKPFSFVQAGLILAAIWCIDAQASVTATFSAGIGFLLTALICQNEFRNKTLKIAVLALVCFFGVFYKITPNDLSFRSSAAFCGVAGKYFQCEEHYAGKFDELSKMRVEGVADFKLNFYKYLSLDVQNVLELLFGEYSNPDYIRFDSNFISMFLNLGLIGLIIYYLFLFQVIRLGRKLFGPESKQAIFLVTTCFVLGFFNATIYKFPINQLIYIYFGYMLSKADIFKSELITE